MTIMYVYFFIVKSDGNVSDQPEECFYSSHGMELGLKMAKQDVFFFEW